MKHFYIKQSNNTLAEEFLQTRNKVPITLTKCKNPSVILQKFKSGAFSQAMPNENKDGEFV